MHLARALACAQSTPEPGDVGANTTQHLALASLAHSRGARTVLFPELSLTGYELDEAPALAFTVDDARLAPLCAFAASTDMTLIVGAPARRSSGLHIAAFIVGPRGDVDVYAKHHLGAFPPAVAAGGPVPPPEASVFAPGLENPAVKCGRGTAGLAICSDIGRPAHAQRAADRGADTYLASAFLIPDDYAGDASRLRGYAVRHRMAVALANYGGPTGGLPSAGRSTIWSPSGAPLVELSESGAGVAVAVEGEDGWTACALSL